MAFNFNKKGLLKVHVIVTSFVRIDVFILVEEHQHIVCIWCPWEESKISLTVDTKSNEDIYACEITEHAS